MARTADGSSSRAASHQSIINGQRRAWLLAQLLQKETGCSQVPNCKIVPLQQKLDCGKLAWMSIVCPGRLASSESNRSHHTLKLVIASFSGIRFPLPDMSKEDFYKKRSYFQTSQ